MGAEMKIYDPDMIVVTFAGIVVKGYADGSMVELEELQPRFTLKKGTDGQGTRSKVLDRSAKCTIHLMQSSEVNDMLSAVATADRLAPNGAGVGAFEIRDLQGTSLHHGAQAWISEVPKVNFDKEATGRDWVITIDDLDSHHGGN